MQQIICRGHKMQEGHTLTLKLCNAHNSCYCSQLLTLPNYIQHDSKIIILTTVVSQFNNQRTLVLLKDNKILSETSNFVCDKILWKTFCQSFILLLKYGTKPKFLREEITQLTFKALTFHEYKSWNLFTVEIRPKMFDTNNLNFNISLTHWQGTALSLESNLSYYIHTEIYSQLSSWEIQLKKLW